MVRLRCLVLAALLAGSLLTAGCDGGQPKGGPTSATNSGPTGTTGAARSLNCKPFAEPLGKAKLESAQRRLETLPASGGVPGALTGVSSLQLCSVRGVDRSFDIDVTLQAGRFTGTVTPSVFQADVGQWTTSGFTVKRAELSPKKVPAYAIYTSRNRNQCLGRALRANRVYQVTFTWETTEAPTLARLTPACDLALHWLQVLTSGP
jgi:hypothetical protein